MRRILRTASRPAHVPVISTAEETLRSFTASGRALFYVFAGALVVSSFGLLYLLNESLLVTVPAGGGVEFRTRRTQLHGRERHGACQGRQQRRHRPSIASALVTR